jgi:hypothetical protein
MVAGVRGWVGAGIECEWLSTREERTLALPSVDRYFSVASICLVRLDEGYDKVTVLSRSPEVTYRMPENGIVETVHGKWPAPLDMIAALACGEVSGASKGRLLYASYWHALSYSPDLRKWVGEQYPTYWKSLVLSFPAMETA